MSNFDVQPIVLKVIERGPRGPAGEAGPEGPPGPPGPVGSDSQVFEYSPPSESDEWIVNHNFGRNPIIAVLSPGGVEVEAEVVHMTVNQARVLFNAPQLGKAIAR